MDETNKEGPPPEIASPSDSSILDNTVNIQDDTINYQTADEENSSKYFSMAETDSTLEVSNITADSTLENKSLADGSITPEASRLLDSLSHISSGTVNKLQIHEKIDAANILSGGVDIFDNNENFVDDNNLVIDDDAHPSEKSNDDMENSTSVDMPIKTYEKLASAEERNFEMFKSRENELADASNTDEVTGIKDGEDETSDECKADTYSALLQGNLPEGSSEVTLLIDEKNVEAVHIGEGVYIYKTDSGDLTAIQITMTQDGQTNIKCLHVGKNEDGNLEVYEEQVNQVAVTKEELESLKENEKAIEESKVREAIPSTEDIKSDVAPADIEQKNILPAVIEPNDSVAETVKEKDEMTTEDLTTQVIEAANEEISEKNIAQDEILPCVENITGKCVIEAVEVNAAETSDIQQNEQVSPSIPDAIDTCHENEQVPVKDGENKVASVLPEVEDLSVINDISPSEVSTEITQNIIDGDKDQLHDVQASTDVKEPLSVDAKINEILEDKLPKPVDDNSLKPVEIFDKKQSISDDIFQEVVPGDEDYPAEIVDSLKSDVNDQQCVVENPSEVKAISVEEVEKPDTNVTALTVESLSSTSDIGNTSMPDNILESNAILANVEAVKKTVPEAGVSIDTISVIEAHVLLENESLQAKNDKEVLNEVNIGEKDAKVVDENIAEMSAKDAIPENSLLTEKSLLTSSNSENFETIMTHQKRTDSLDSDPENRMVIVEEETSSSEVILDNTEPIVSNSDNVTMKQSKSMESQSSLDSDDDDDDYVMGEPVTGDIGAEWNDSSLNVLEDKHDDECGKKHVDEVVEKEHVVEIGKDLVNELAKEHVEEPENKNVDEPEKMLANESGNKHVIEPEKVHVDEPVKRPIDETENKNVDVPKDVLASELENEYVTQKEHDNEPVKELPKDLDIRHINEPENKLVDEPLKKCVKEAEKKHKEPAKKHVNELEKRHLLASEKKRLYEPEKKNVNYQEEKHVNELKKKHFNELEKRHVNEIEKHHVNVLDRKHVGAPEKKHASTPENRHVSSQEKKHVSAPERKHVSSPEKKHVSSPERKHVISPEKKHVSSPEKKHVSSPERKHVISPEKKHVSSPEKKQVYQLENIGFYQPDRKHLYMPPKKHVNTPERRPVDSPENKHANEVEKKHVNVYERRHLLSPEKKHVSTPEKKHDNELKKKNSHEVGDNDGILLFRSPEKVANTVLDNSSSQIALHSKPVPMEENRISSFSIDKSGSSASGRPAFQDNNNTKLLQYKNKPSDVNLRVSEKADSKPLRTEINFDKFVRRNSLTLLDESCDAQTDKHILCAPAKNYSKEVAAEAENKEVLKTVEKSVVDKKDVIIPELENPSLWDKGVKIISNVLVNPQKALSENPVYYSKKAKLLQPKTYLSSCRNTENKNSALNYNLSDNMGSHERVLPANTFQYPKNDSSVSPKFGLGQFSKVKTYSSAPKSTLKINHFLSKDADAVKVLQKKREESVKLVEHVLPANAPVSSSKAVALPINNNDRTKSTDIKLLSSQDAVEKPKDTSNAVRANSVENDANSSADESTCEQAQKGKSRQPRKQVFTPVTRSDMEIIFPNLYSACEKLDKSPAVKPVNKPKMLKLKESFKNEDSTTVEKTPKSDIPPEKTVPQKEKVDKATETADSSLYAPEEMSKSVVPTPLITPEKVQDVSGAQKQVDVKVGDASNTDSPASSSAKRKRGRPKKIPQADSPCNASVETNKVNDKNSSPKTILVEKCFSPPAKSMESPKSEKTTPKISSISPFGKINENIVCPICFKTFRTENVLLKHVKHCNGAIDKEVILMKSPRKRKSAIDTSTEEPQSETRSGEEGKAETKRLKETVLSDAAPSKKNISDNVDVLIEPKTKKKSLEKINIDDPKSKTEDPKLKMNDSKTNSDVTLLTNETKAKKDLTIDKVVGVSPASKKEITVNDIAASKAKKADVVEAVEVAKTRGRKSSPFVATEDSKLSRSKRGTLVTEVAPVSKTRKSSRFTESDIRIEPRTRRSQNIDSNDVSTPPKTKKILSATGNEVNATPEIQKITPLVEPEETYIPKIKKSALSISEKKDSSDSNAKKSFSSENDISLASRSPSPTKSEVNLSATPIASSVEEKVPVLVTPPKCEQIVIVEDTPVSKDVAKVDLKDELSTPVKPSNDGSLQNASLLDDKPDDSSDIITIDDSVAYTPKNSPEALHDPEPKSEVNSPFYPEEISKDKVDVAKAVDKKNPDIANPPVKAIPKKSYISEKNEINRKKDMLKNPREKMVGGGRKPDMSQNVTASPMSRLSKILNTKPPTIDVIACEICGKTFRQLPHMVYHRNKHILDGSAVPDAVKVTDNIKTIVEAVVKPVVNEQPVESTSEASTMLKCDVCSKGFRKLHHLVEHREVHSNSETKSRRTSVASVKSEPEAGFRCDTCDKSFRKLHHLVEHREHHLAEVVDPAPLSVAPLPVEAKPAEDATCSGCGKSFRKRHHMVEHRDIHCSPSKKGKPDDSEGSSGNVRLSIASSNSDDGNSCGICGKSYRKLYHMIEHRESHTENNPKPETEHLNTKDIIHECSKCYMVFPNENSLNKHVVICLRKRLINKTKLNSSLNTDDIPKPSQENKIIPRSKSLSLPNEEPIPISEVETVTQVAKTQATNEVTKEVSAKPKPRVTTLTKVTKKIVPKGKQMPAKTKEVKLSSSDTQVKYKLNPAYFKGNKSLPVESKTSKSAHGKRRVSASSILSSVKILETIQEETCVRYSFPKTPKDKKTASPAVVKPAPEPSVKVKKGSKLLNKGVAKGVVSSPIIKSKKLAMSSKKTALIAEQVKRPVGRPRLSGDKVAVPKKLELKCCRQTFESQVTLATHRKTHKGARSVHKCDCGKSFESEVLLRRHIDTHHTPPKSFRCGECGVSVRTAAQYSKHRQTHATKPGTSGTARTKTTNPGRVGKKKAAHGGVPLSDKMRKAIAGAQF